MPDEKVVPIPDAELAEVRRMHAAATDGEWRGTYYCKPDGTEIKTVDDVVETLAYSGRISPLTELFGVSIEDGKDICMTGNGPTSQANAGFIAVLHNSFGPLLARLEAAERERDERMTMAARAQEALRYVMNGLPANDAVWAAYGNADSARAWLAARDAQQLRAGAAKALDEFAGQMDTTWTWKQINTKLKKEAKRIREGEHD